MNTREFRVWLAVNGYTQKQLAILLGISETTISNYIKADRFPIVFQLALKGLEK